MSLAYYNENDPFCVAWLKNLIADKLIAKGEVDDRSILDVRPIDLRGFTQHHFFAGIGGWSLALRLADWPDTEKVWTGSCPCQPFSAAGKRRGFADDRHLWPHWRYLIAVCRPASVLGEQVASAAEWLRLVRGDLEALGYAVGAMPVEAASAGADHLRDRYWLVSDRAGEQVGAARQPQQRGDVAYSSSTRLPQRERDGRVQQETLGAYFPERRIRNEQRAGQQPLDEQDQGARSLGNGASKPQRESHHQGHTFAAAEQARSVSGSTGRYEWAIGADGKARRVKSGIRLLAHGVSGRLALERTDEQGQPETHWYSRIGALKGLGNAIDPRPASEFIKAWMYCRP